jgi:hypothetical protein
MKIIVLFLRKLFLNCKVTSLQESLDRFCTLCSYKVKEQTPEYSIVDVYFDNKLQGTLVFEFNSDNYITNIYERQ